MTSATRITPQVLAFFTIFAPMQSSIKKLYHSIAEAATLVGEEQHVLRYWEREFPQLRPQKNRAGNRVYTQRDIAVLLVIKQLLREKRYTVAGAREHLRYSVVPDDGVVAHLSAAVESPEGVESTSESSEHAPGSINREHAIALVQELRTLAADLRAKVSVVVG